MSIRNWALAGGVIAAAAVAGVATSQQPPPAPTAATVTPLTPSRADNAALAQARQDPVAARLRGVLAQARARGLTNIRTERTEYGVDVTFSRFGAAYNVTFICEGAPNCTEADAIVFAAGLQLIGGGA